jgi:RHS repeat-associated protein
LTTGPAGSYTYANASFRDAVTSTSGGYGASYDGAGDMTCRAPTSSQTCSGSQTGQQVSYDQLRRILNWQNAASTPTATAHYAYDGEGSRTVQNSTVNGTQTVTYYVGSYQEVATSGSTTTTTKYYSTAVATGVDVNGTLSYLISDGLGNASASLDANGNEVGADLYLPYGGVRYTNGSLSTTKGFTGQVQDPSGLDYFHARYYDPVVGQFATEDTVQGPNRYAYVAGNPETNTDPTGQAGIYGGAGMADGINWGAVDRLAPQEAGSIDPESSAPTPTPKAHPQSTPAQGHTSAAPHASLATRRMIGANSNTGDGPCDQNCVYNNLLTGLNMQISHAELGDQITNDWQNLFMNGLLLGAAIASSDVIGIIEALADLVDTWVQLSDDTDAYNGIQVSSQTYEIWGTIKAFVGIVKVLTGVWNMLMFFRDWIKGIFKELAGTLFPRLIDWILQLWTGTHAVTDEYDLAGMKAYRACVIEQGAANYQKNCKANYHQP